MSPDTHGLPNTIRAYIRVSIPFEGGHRPGSMWATRPWLTQPAYTACAVEPIHTGGYRKGNCVGEPTGPPPR